MNELNVPNVGDKICTDLVDRGTTYVDGGYDISPATNWGARLINGGIIYVDSDGRACAQRP